ncbi:MAG: hypothetical protein ACAH59_10135 [Pseudobdellovibrionaceae bacterium]
MKSFFFTFFFIFSLIAKAETLSCQVHKNTALVFTQELTVDPKSQVKIGELEGYRFYLNHLGSQKFEIETFDPNGPARFYSAGFLTSVDQILELTNWTRDILLSITCQRK